MTLVTNITPPIDSRHSQGAGRYTPVAAAGSRAAPTPRMKSLQTNAASALEKFGAAMDAMNFAAAASHLREAQMFVDMLAGNTDTPPAPGAVAAQSAFATYSLNAILEAE
jgi:hypothetical protein